MPLSIAPSPYRDDKFSNLPFLTEANIDLQAMGGCDV